MKKPTFEISNESFLEVVDDCEKAQGECPQHIFFLEDVELNLFKGKIIKARFLHDFATCETLFKYGYSESLSEETLDILDEVRIYKSQVDMWNRRNEDDMILDFDSMYRFTLID